MAEPNAIVIENQLPGNPESEWGLSDGPSLNIEGFTTEYSVNHGNEVEFKINTDSTDYRIDIYRLGFYDGAGARLVASLQHQDTLGTIQPSAMVDVSTGVVDAGNWSISDSWLVPSDAVSGVYIAKLVRQDGVAGESQVPFVVRSDDSNSAIVFQTSDTTWQAYNTWGGHSLYDGSSVAVSYNRPFSSLSGANSIFGPEHQTIQWLEANGYDVSYIGGVDTAREGDAILNHQLFLSVGHDEYWSAEQRVNVEAARNAGVNLAFLGGNDVYWKTQWENSLDGTTPFRTMVTYKETTLGKSNPSGEWTGTWRDPNGASTGGNNPENSLTGTLFVANSPGSPQPIVLTYDYSQLRFWRNTLVSVLDSGETLELAGNLLGYEFNQDVFNDYRPLGLIDLSSTTLAIDSAIQDAGSLFGPGTVNHNMTLYRSPSGSLVYSAGTILWGNALNPSLGLSGDSTGVTVQQSMVNLFADMGVQPTTLGMWLVPAVQSTDYAAPVTAIAGYTYASPNGKINLMGSSIDIGGGTVAGIEVSGDNGDTWHPAAIVHPETGTTIWEASGLNVTTYDSPGITTAIVIARAIDDSLNIEATTSTTISVTQFIGYLGANLDVFDAGLDPLYHYVEFGASEGRDPAFNFDQEIYLAQNPDVDAAGINPLEHYLWSGITEGRKIENAVGRTLVDGFDVDYYALAYPDVDFAGVDLYAHWLDYGRYENRNPSGYFDTQYYLTTYTDVAAAGVNPLDHFMVYGWQEGRNPSASFDTTAYLTANPDVAAEGINPLNHYMLYGAREGRQPMGV